MINQILVRIISTIVLILIVVAIAGFIPGLLICDLISQFRIIFAILLLLCLLFLMLLRSKAFSFVCFAGFLLNGLPIGVLYLPRDCSQANKPFELNILNFNTEFQHNDNFASFEKVLHERNPDVLAIVEVDQKWIDGIAGATKTYQFQKIVLKGAGMAIFSKYPLENIEVRYYGKSHHPRIAATVNTGDHKIAILTVHPPTPQSDERYQERDRELALVADEMGLITGPKILVGDFNCGPWAAAFQSLLKSGFVDSEQGFGAQPSWPARSGRAIENVPLPPLIPIDHVLVSSDICVVERKVGPAVGSDHLPVFVKLALATKSKAIHSP